MLIFPCRTILILLSGRYASMDGGDTTFTVMGLHTVRFYLKWRTELWQFFSSKILDHDCFALVRSLIHPVINVIVAFIHSIWKGKSLG